MVVQGHVFPPIHLENVLACVNPIKVLKPGSNISRDMTYFAGSDVYFNFFPCGQCRHCRLRQRLDWAVRCSLEALDHDSSCVLTLTYDPGRATRKDGGLNAPDLTNFLKLLRYHSGERFRYFACGEYGSGGPGDHPHFHVICFGLDFEDRYFLKRSRSGVKLYASDLLDKAWPHGFALLDPKFTWESACYVVGYLMKKINGDLADDHYRGLPTEFIRVSNKPGLGRSWYELNCESMYEAGCVTLGEKDFFVPRKFDDWTRSERPELWSTVLADRASLVESECCDA